MVGSKAPVVNANRTSDELTNIIRAGSSINSAKQKAARRTMKAANNYRTCCVFPRLWILLVKIVVGTAKKMNPKPNPAIRPDASAANSG